ncbi:F0F1 ATP synthase subunit A [bacterium]|nr:F0F1 ATP synthase subunit A [candidate division CSSED10-310 bacterium]
MANRARTILMFTDPLLSLIILLTALNVLLWVGNFIFHYIPSEIDVNITQPKWRFLGQEINKNSMIMTWIVSGIMLLGAFLVKRCISRSEKIELHRLTGERETIVVQPEISRVQALAEIVVEFLDGLSKDSLGDKGRLFAPYIGTLFLFLWFSNIIGFVPMFQEPTKDASVPVGLALLGFVITQVAAVRYRGLWAWIKSFAEPMVLMAPINIAGELAKVVSISMRLFGNILGGAIIVTILSSMFNYLFVSAGLYMFFSFFTGTIQAFVFTVLTATYLAIAVD